MAPAKFGRGVAPGLALAGMMVVAGVGCRRGALSLDGGGDAGGDAGEKVEATHPTEGPSALADAAVARLDSPSVVPGPMTTEPVPAALPPTAPAPTGEAKRATLPSLERDASLRPQLAALREHFRGGDAGGDVRGPFLEQRIERAGGGSAFLLSRADESDPIVLAVERDRLLFVRNRPVAGITPPALHVTIAPGPERGIAVFSYVPAEHLVAARMWADDGNPFAEVVTLTTDACDALAVAYGAGWGWVLACSSSTGTRAQRLREDLTSAWGTEGAVVGAAGPAERPVITLEDAQTWALTQRVKAVGGDRTLTFRYGPDASPVAQPMPSSSTSKTSVELGGMTGGKPRAP